MLAKVLMCASAAIALLLGTTHLVYTFWSNKFSPRDAQLMTLMQNVSPRITRHTTMWQAWIGFNASHSMGAMLFGLVYGYLAINHSALLFASAFLLVVGLAMLVGFLVLGVRYWFRIPIIGIAIALACYVLAIALAKVA